MIENVLMIKAFVKNRAFLCDMFLDFKNVPSVGPLTITAILQLRRLTLKLEKNLLTFFLAKEFFQHTANSGGRIPETKNN